MLTFRYSTPIIETFPSIVGGVMIGTVINSSASDELLARYREEQQLVIERIGDTPLSEIESLHAWRQAFRAFGVNPTKYRSAAEALLRRLTKKGDIPSLNTLVDIGNLVSIRYHIPVAVFDVRDLVGDDLVVEFASGVEEFFPIGADGPEYPEEGEVIFADAARQVYARRWCWRQSLGSAARDDTTQVIVTAEAHHAAGKHDVEQALEDLRQLLSSYAAFEGAQGIVTERVPAFSAQV
jgi:DNA/RNA-binding domain of Phe-tRNA-synthetase-like protein